MKNCVFGVGEFDGIDVIFLTDKEVWENSKCCSDQCPENVYDVMETNGLYELEDGIWELPEGMDRQEAKELMLSFGSSYDAEFESFMSANEDDE